MTNPAKRISWLLSEAIGKKGYRTDEFLKTLFEVETQFEIYTILYWIDKDLQQIIQKLKAKSLSMDTYSLPLGHAQSIIECKCLSATIGEIPKSSLTMFDMLSDMLYPDYNDIADKQESQEIEKLLLVIKEESKKEEGFTKEMLEEMVEELEQGLKLSRFCGIAPLKRKNEIAFGKFVCIYKRIQNKRLSQKTSALFKLLFELIQKSNDTFSFISNILNLLNKGSS